MLTNEQVASFHKNGFVKGGQVLDDEQVEQLRHELDLVMSGQSVKKPVLNRNMLEGSELDMNMEQSKKVVQIVNIWMASDAFLNHAANAKMCEEVAQLARTNTLRIWHDQIQYKPPVTGGPTRWHQDHPAWPIIQPADLVSAWVALDDATIDNGAMWMVPESHTWGNHDKFLTSTDDFKPVHRKPELLPDHASIEAVPFEIKKGHVGYHHCMTWHGSHDNRSERKRRAIAVHYMPGHTRYEPTGQHPMEAFIEVQAEERLIGDTFPVVFERNATVVQNG
ncbi:phytanoyl-CoA dioxygenase family protein [Aureibacillus halotolerans]|uniref:Phytanoyl-CoA dioxygenase PhyH n=1 Tax=Aureibacillus halotolerans TaxID=1508390 RepID=A0A4R6U2W0_9BACI|nr:phytanoyl-CoA dioxygenase family protein [Aureibacillus halotolerans]TDQ40768.1 phytanoyl-CoA dioxygenase PhyH [Aureibacillus halotolerans]